MKILAIYLAAINAAAFVVMAVTNTGRSTSNGVCGSLR